MVAMAEATTAGWRVPGLVAAVASMMRGVACAAIAERGERIAAEVLRVGERQTIPAVGLGKLRQLYRAAGERERAEPELDHVWVTLRRRTLSRGRDACHPPRDAWWLTALMTAFSDADEMLLSMPTPQRTALCAVGQLDVRRGAGLVAGAERVLGVVDHVDRQAEAPLQRIDERGDRSVAGAFDGQIGSPSTSSCAVSWAPLTPSVTSWCSSCSPAFSGR